MAPARIFLLSPANCGGTRAKQVLSPNAQFALAAELRSRRGAMLGDVFMFVSGLYFRGKLTYALRFAAPPGRDHPIIGCGVHVITPNAGLRSPDTYVTHKAVLAFAGGDVHQDNAAYRRPLERSARTLAREVGPDCDVVLLGSIASPKYVDVLLGIFGGQLRFPIDFVGRGDMSRGGLLLRRSREGVELEYAPVAGAVRHGARPPKLPPLRPYGSWPGDRSAGPKG
ncbi:MAG TPA: hypothetical protein VG222_07455 [Vicinamibacterales bacterium]|nr:hypothetical protein [Vicinamibacterales bacterium]